MKLMKRTKPALLVALALGASALLAGAQDNNEGPAGGPGGPGGPGGHRHPPLPVVSVLDANHDGVIDATEIANASAALKTLDANGDGVLTTNEYLPPLPKHAPPNAHRPPLPLILKALDANGDGVIDATEIANASAALKALDTNGDGGLTRDEYLGKPPQRGNGPGGGHPGEAGAGGPPDEAPAGPPPGEN
jgi:hypothetical protein